ncbi:MAG: VWA domain-containing protein, partial [Candidatus Acidiferrales bacterium]
MSKRSASTKLIIFCLFIAAGALGWRALVAPQIARAQQGAAPPAAAPVDAQQEQTPAGGAIKAETREVRVDVVVTDKKGNYVQDLTTNDFRLYEDEKQQFINSFSFGADPNAPVQAQRHYLVLFFDNSSMDLSDQPRARASAGKFIDAYAGPDRVMAIVNFGGSLQIVQNFTSDTARLKEAVSGISSSAVSPNASASNGGASSAGVPSAAAVMPGMQTGFPGMGKAEGDFGAYTLLLSIRELAKGLADVPGRKSLVLFTAGFALSPERMSELTATIDACNRSNVAVYPLDVRGLVTPLSQIPGGGALDALETSARQSQNATGWTSAARSSARATSYAARDSAAAQY